MKHNYFYSLNVHLINATFRLVISSDIYCKFPLSRLFGQVNFFLIFEKIKLFQDAAAPYSSQRNARISFIQ